MSMNKKRGSLANGPRKGARKTASKAVVALPKPGKGGAGNRSGKTVNGGYGK